MTLQAEINFVPADDVSAMLDLEPFELEELCNAKVLLSLRLSGGELVFPSFQFDLDGLRPKLIVSLQKYFATHDAWDATIWFYTWNDNCGSYPKDLLTESNGYEKLSLLLEVETGLSTL